MANFSSLKQAIQNYIKENGNKEITGNLLQEILLSMVVTMGDNAINSLTTIVNELNTILHSVDAEPTKNSENLVRSGGVWSGINREALRALDAETTFASFNSTNNHVEFFNHWGDILYWYDASAFITTGLVEDVYIEDDNLVFVINTSAGEKTIEVPLEDVFNPNNYYTKTQIDGIIRTIRELYDGAEYRGFITPSSQAESKQGVKMVCFATEAGTYTNFLANYDTPIEIPVRGIWVFERGVDADDWTAYSLLEIDKVYAPAQASGMGRVVLQKNMVGGVNTLTQAAFEDSEGNDRENTIYVIQYDFTLGENITVPANCVLKFDGGSISNGTITGNNTGIESGFLKIFDSDITLSGTWNIEKIYVEWFDDIHDAFDFGNLTHTTIQLLNKVYSFDTPLRMYSNMSLVGMTSQAWAANDRASTLYYTGETGAAILMEDDAITRNVYIRDLNIFSTKGRDYDTTGIFMDSDCHYLEISNVTVKYFKYGIRESYSWHSMFQNVCAYGCDTGFLFDNNGFTATSLVSCIAYACNVGYDLLGVTPTYSSIVACGSDQCGVGIKIGNARELNLVGFGFERFVDYGIYIKGSDANVNFIGPSISGPMKDSNDNPINPNAINVFVESCSSVIFQNVKVSSAWVAPNSYSFKIGEGQETKVMFLNCNISKMHSSCKDATHINNNTLRVLTANFSTSSLGGIDIGYHREVLLTSTYTGSSAMSLVGNPTFITDTMQTGETLKVINGSDKTIYIRTTSHTATSGILPPVYGRNSIELEPESYVILQKNSDGNLEFIEMSWSQNVGYQSGNTISRNRSATAFKDGQVFYDTQLGIPSIMEDNSWIKADGSSADARRTGTFAEKPNSDNIYIGYSYFCTDKQTTEGATNGIMIYYKGIENNNAVWVDALGRVVS